LAGVPLVLGAIAWVLISKQSAAAEVRQQKLAADKRRKFSREQPAEAQVVTPQRSRAREFGRR
jgi:hypothetical protein